MKAAVLVETGRIEVLDRAIPRVDSGDVLVRVRAASICGTDIRIFRHGHFKLAAGTPRVLGHEVAGEIAEVGSSVVGFRVGDRVSVTPNIGCGHCRYCRRGLNQMCPDYEAFGITLDGGFEEFMLVPSRAIERGNLFRIPDSISFDHAALMEPISCCLSGQNALRIEPSDKVLIIGSGPIGCFHTLLAKRAGVETVMISNNRRPRLEIAQSLGADLIIPLSEVDQDTEVLRATEGEGADVIITCVSRADVVASVTRILARLGRVNVFSGLGQQESPQIDVNSLHYKAQTFTGTTGSSNSDYARVIELIAEAPFDLDPVISGRFPLEDIDAAFEHSISGVGMKSLITFGEIQ